MTSSRHNTAQAGDAEVHRLGARVIEVRMRGRISRLGLTECLAKVLEILRQQPDIDTILWDAGEMTGYDPGNPALAIQWSREHLTAVTHSLVVTRNQIVAGLVRVGQVMIPAMKARVFTRREDALAFLDECARARRHRAA